MLKKTNQQKGNMKTNEHTKNFKNYFWSFYGPEVGIYKDFFNNNLTIKELDRALKIRLSNMKLEFDGDSIDREIVRDIIFKLRDPKSKTEHKFNFKIK
tara:strand:+ start:166 stop:459 length:294 start_codon:yes stop_codon:yes gene_type:complete